MSYFLYACFAHFLCILEQVNKEILGRHETRNFDFIDFGFALAVIKTRMFKFFSCLAER